MLVPQPIRPMEKLSPDQRLAELARILARGLLRLREKERDAEFCRKTAPNSAREP